MSWISALIQLKFLKRRKRRGKADPTRMTLPLVYSGRGSRIASLEEALPRFRSIADDQSSANRPGHFGDIRLRLRTAFTPARPVTDWRVFAGRTEILNALIRAIEESQLHVVLYGERGVGKTSILNILAQSARDARYLVVYVPCDTKSDFDEVIRSIATKIPLLFHGEIDPTAPEAEAGKALADVLPAGPLTARSVADVFANVVGTRVIVILDEFDRSESQSFRQSVAELLKMLSDRAMRVQLVIAGVAPDLMELLEYVPSAQRNIFALHIPQMSADEVRQLVRNGERIVGLRFDDAAVEGVVSVIDGFPYFANLVCHYASLHALDDGRTNVTRGDVLEGLRGSLAELSGRLARRSHAEISVCAGAGELPALYDLARVALLAGGLIEPESLRQFASAPSNVERCGRLLQDLLSRKRLVELVPGSANPTCRFVDGNVVAYLWMKAAEARFDVAYSGDDGSDPTHLADDEMANDHVASADLP